MGQEEENSSLFRKYINGECSGEDLEKLFRYFAVSKEEDLRLLIIAELEREEGGEVYEREEISGHVGHLYGKISQRINDHKHQTSGTISVFNFRLIAAVAAVFLIAVLFVLQFRKTDSETSGSKVSIQKESIRPGGNKAVLTLANGKKIILDDAGNGKLASVAGMTVTKTNDGQVVYKADQTVPSGDANNGGFNTIGTPKGGQYQVVLPDGTKVWLNAASEIRFPTRFDTRKRKVEVRGEAYFEVSKAYTAGKSGGHLPFIVKTKYQDVLVLGTHFNVKAYEEEGDTRTTLLEGSVLVKTQGPEALHQGSEVKLKPGQQAVNNNNNRSVTLLAVDTDDVIAWKNGLFSFNDTDIRTIMGQIRRWYDVEVDFEGNMQGRQFTGTVSRYQNVSQVLEMLESTGAVHFKIEGRRIIVMP